MDDMRLDAPSNEPARQPEAVATSFMASAIRMTGRPARTASFRHRSINCNSAVASGSSFFNGWRSTPGTTPLTSQLALLISTTTTKVEIGSNAARLRLRSLIWTTGQPPSVRMDDEGATTSAARPIASPTLGVTAKPLRFAVCAPARVTRLCGTSRLGWTRPAHVRSRGSQPLLRIRSLAGYTIDTHESRFRKRHPIVDILSPTWIQDLIQAYGLWVLFTVVMLESM